MSKLPWFKFFPTDWRADVGLKLCSLCARGLWLEMICIMHEAGGYLEINGSPVSIPALAALSGTTTQEITGLLGELEEAGVFSRDRKGRLYSRRMLRDLKKASTARNNGRKGGNPALAKAVVQGQRLGAGAGQGQDRGPVRGQGQRKGNGEGASSRVSRKRENSDLDKVPHKEPDKSRLNTQKPETRVQTHKITPKGVNKNPEYETVGSSADNAKGEPSHDDFLVDPEGGEFTQLLREMGEMGESLVVDENLGEGSQRFEDLSFDPVTQKTTPKTMPKTTHDQSDINKRGVRLSENWEPTNDDITFARKRGLKDELLATEALKFRNYWTSLAGRKACKLDWHRTWQNWVLRGYENGSGNLAKSRGAFGRSRAHGQQSGGQRPGGLDLAEIGARVLGRAQAQDDLSQERGQLRPAGGGDFAQKNGS
ncbi:hypothetical protein [Kiloniella antarctica]|uniref:DUF1376 domain-containing protein n=1 Tax=Kiloniella antarctica TaxID=1550907 RepID=A0ABW5BI39_9PROT